MAANLFHPYNIMTSHLTKDNHNWDPQALEEVLVMLQQLRASWMEVPQRARRGELEENGEAVDAAPERNLGSLRV